MHTRQEQLEQFDRLLTIMKELRQHCPWDREQTFESLRTLTIEETYELADAILKDDKQEITKELGDLLLHVVFYAEIGRETGDFDIYDVMYKLSEKLIYRHPHIYAAVDADDSTKVMQNWEDLKLKEKGGNKSVLSGVPMSLPALIKAHRIQDKARSVGFDWDEKEQVWDKVNEEFEELQAEIGKMDADKMEDEFGDLLFSIINAGRLYGINPENALERTNRKFIERFNYMESQTIAKGLDLKKMNLEELERYWQEAKNHKR
ncbi:MAG: nucleoside triphosphate pyrophosphohydrolase [Bacteroidales bacterium]|jgi:XTP/dITP diphosphohydrolase|nr:nucleoside triphosphate pyrophosphohydrolase [Bacteroidales bacterium]